MKNLTALNFFPKKKLLLLFVLRLLLNGFNVFISILIQVGLTFVIQKRISHLFTIFFVMIFGSVIYTFLFFLSGYILELVKKELSKKMSFALVTGYLYEPQSKPISKGEAVNLLVSDVQNLIQYLEFGLLPLFDFILTILLGVVYVISQSLLMMIVFLILGIIFGLAAWWLFINQSTVQKGISKIDDRQKSFFESFINTLPVIRNLLVSNYIIKNHEKYYQEKEGGIKTFSKTVGYLSGILNGGVYLAEIATLLLGYALIRLVHLSIPSMLGVWNAGIGSILWPFLSLPNTLNYVIQERTSMERISKRINTPKKDKYVPLIKPQNLKNNKKDCLLGRHVSFKYSNNSKDIFTDFDFRISARGITYIVGDNGTGKTTLLKLIIGILKPTSGAITYKKDGKNSSVENGFAFVPQISSLFDDSVIGNVTLGEKIKAERVKSVLKLVNLDEISNNLTRDIDPDELSGGQTRRLAVARAILSHKPFILLDEPFSDIDSFSQKKIIDVLRKEATKRSIVIVTHTFDTIRPEDNIIRW
ncbi:ATP-binding cassette domain-containing protein [Oenococcus oeni]|uniref:ATP-binding cassette domain-containing protein n=1 Tax=Oenococcus oeni TaxID=1247 RepID=UPI0010BA52F9|nr:ABC transporter ATP-binding protein [Oenococcus oeni]SYW14179.1 ABC transporter ATP-binding protein [Oenococcus oeni]